MIENLAALSTWAERSQPSDSVYRIVAEWILAAEHFPWRAPSQPLGEPGPIQRRTVFLADVEVRVTYNHEHRTGILTLIEVEWSSPYVDPDGPESPPAPR